ncbi:MAG: hypothetical protein U0V70_07765 [Terriglobia bacterium]
MKTQFTRIFVIVFSLLMVGELHGQAQGPNPPDEQSQSGWRRFGQPSTNDPLPPPLDLTLPAGTWITVRMDQMLSSDHNQQGDAFTATLVQPLVAEGRILARPGQTVGGVVASSQKAGRVKGTSSLGLELTEISIADGRQVQVKTTLMQRRGDTSVGQDAGIIGTSTGMGAAIGATIDGGFGAGMGAIAGAAASTIGVLVTRGRATVVSPEDVLTFRIVNPVSVQIAATEGAFQPVQQADYEQPRLARQGPPPPQGSPAPRVYLGASYPPYYYGGYYSPYYYGGFYAPYTYGFGFSYYPRPYYSYHGHGAYYGNHGGYHGGNHH